MTDDEKEKIREFYEKQLMACEDIYVFFHIDEKQYIKTLKENKLLDMYYEELITCYYYDNEKQREQNEQYAMYHEEIILRFFNKHNN